jgi:hypothetical protein
MARPIFDNDIWGETVKAYTDELDRPTSIDIGNGWLEDNYPTREYENWAKWIVFSACQWFEEKGFFDWDSNITYAQYALVNYSGVIYISILGTNLNQQPDTATTYWTNFYDWLIGQAGQTMVVANEAALGTGVIDGQIRGTVDGNLYTWDDTDTKWNARAGNIYSTTPAFGNVQFSAGTTTTISGATWRYNGTTWEEIGSVIVGALERPEFGPNASSTQIDLKGPAGYHLDGIGWVWWDGTIAYNFTTLAASTMSYLYIDKSTITGPGKITASNLIDSTTAPSYSSTKGGEYNGDDRCIMGVYGLGATSYEQFEHDGSDFIQYSSQISEVSSTAITTGGVDYALTVPAFVKKVKVNFRLNYTSATVLAYLRKGGSTVSGHIVSWVTATVVIDTGNSSIILDGSQQINVYGSAAGAIFWLNTNGFYLGHGM